MWHVLLNPAAGSRSTSPTQVTRALQTAGIPHELRVPVSSDEMRAAVDEAVAAQNPRLAVVGGDGTVNLAVNVLMRYPRPQRPLLGVLPAGTGCDLLRTFAIPQDLEAAAHHLSGDNLYQVDVGLLEGDWGRTHFVNVAQAGVGAAAVQTAEGMSRRWGAARYPLAFVGRLPRFPAATVNVELEGRSHQGSALATIFANGQFFAGGWNIAPRSTLMDGRLDLQIIDCAKREAVRLVPKIIRGLHLTDRSVRRYATRGFRLTTDPIWPVEADGELVGNTPVTVSVEAGALSLKI